MRIDKRSRLLLRLHGLVFSAGFVLVLVLVAWLSTRFDVSGQWSSAGRVALSEATVSLLQRMDEPLEMVVFVQPNDILADHVNTLVARYQQHKPDLRYQIINPDSRPDLARELGIEGSGEIILIYRGQQERVRVPSEPRLSAAMQRLHRRDNRPVVYLSGHGERSLQGEANHDLGAFGNYLLESGHQLQALEPGQAIPPEAAMLVVAGPRSVWSDDTRHRLEQYLADGGNLLWLIDGGDDQRLDFLARRLSLRLLPGIVVEPRAEELLGVDNPELLALGNYPGHPALGALEGVSLFVRAQALEMEQSDANGDAWNASPLLMTDSRHWSETSDTEKPHFDAQSGDRQGPLALGFGLSREHPGSAAGTEAEQRVVVVGDADFLSNAYLGNGVNLNLGLKLVDWLAAGEGLVDVHGQATPDQRLGMSERMLVVVGMGWLLVLPGVFVGIAGVLWWRRRRA